MTTKQDRKRLQALQHAAQLGLQQALIRGENGNRLIRVTPQGPFHVVASRLNHEAVEGFGREIWFRAAESYLRPEDAFKRMLQLREWESLAEWSLAVVTESGQEIARLGEVR